MVVYKNEEEEEGDSKSDNELHSHEGHPSKLLGELFAALQPHRQHCSE